MLSLQTGATHRCGAILIASKETILVNLKRETGKKRASGQFTEDGPQYALSSGHCVYDQKTKTLISPGAVQEKLTQTSHNPNLVQILMRIRSSSQSCQLVIGEHDLSRTGDTPRDPKSLTVIDVIVHEDYVNNKVGQVTLKELLILVQNLASDLALLELEEDVDLSVYPPVCLTGPDHVTNQTETVAIGQLRITYKMEMWALCQVGALLLAGSNLSTQMWSATRLGERIVLGLYTRYGETTFQ